MRILVCVLLLVAACKKATRVDELSLETRSLPGFSIGMPKGKEMRVDTGDYGNGLVQLQLGNAGIVAVTWTDSPIETDEDAAMFAEMIGKGLGAPGGKLTETDEFSAGDLRVRSFTSDMGSTGLAASLIVCGSREISVVTAAAAKSGYRGLHGRVVGSIVCTPDPSREGEVGRPPPIAVDVPEGWTPTEAELGQLAWESDNGALLFQYVQIDPDSPAVRKGIEALLSQFGGGAIDEVEKEGGRTLYKSETTFEGERIGLVATVFECGPRQAMGIFFGPPGDPLGKTVLLSARCE